MIKINLDQLIWTVRHPISLKARRSHTGKEPRKNQGPSLGTKDIDTRDKMIELTLKVI